MTRHGLLWIVAIMLIFLFAPLLVHHKDYEHCLLSELQSANRWYDEESVNTIVVRTNKIYSVLLINTGIDPILRRSLSSPMDSKELAPGVDVPRVLAPYAEQMMDYWGNMLLNFWLFFFRISHSLSWMAYLTPFIAAIAFDGIMTRKAKLASFKYTSPTVYNMSWHMIIAIASISLVAFAFVTPLSIFFYPIVITGMGILLRLLISNIQHSA